MVPLLPLSDPYAIFDRATAYWQNAAYPDTVGCNITVSVTRKNVVSTVHYHSRYDAATNKVSTDPFSDEEIAHPYVPKGIRTTIQLSLYLAPLRPIPLGAQDFTYDYLGVPQIAPNYAFGMRNIPSQTVNPSTDSQSVASPNLKTIISVQSANRRYSITLVGTSLVGDHLDYDLHLAPVDDPRKYRIRELWIDADTFATDRLLSQGNFSYGGMQGVPWLVTFQSVGGAPYIATETAQSSFTLDRRIYDSATIAFDKIAPLAPSMLPSLPRFDSGPPPRSGPYGVPPSLEEP